MKRTLTLIITLCLLLSLLAIGASAEEISLSLGLASDKNYIAHIQTVENNALTEKRPLAIGKEGSTQISLPMYSIAFIEIEEA